MSLKVLLFNGVACEALMLNCNFLFIHWGKRCSFGVPRKKHGKKKKLKNMALA